MIDNGNCITIDKLTGIVRIDGLPAFRLVALPTGIVVQFQDSDKMRSRYRGDRFIEVPLEALALRLNELGAELT